MRWTTEARLGIAAQLLGISELPLDERMPEAQSRFYRSGTGEAEGERTSDLRVAEKLADRIEPPLRQVVVHRCRAGRLSGRKAQRKKGIAR